MPRQLITHEKACQLVEEIHKEWEVRQAEHGSACECSPCNPYYIIGAMQELVRMANGTYKQRQTEVTQ